MPDLGTQRFSALTVTIVYATYGIGVLAALLLLGPLSDRYGRRRILLPGLALSAASSVVFLLAQALRGVRRRPRGRVARVAYLALSVPIIGVGLATQASGLRTAGLTFSACVVFLSLAVLVSLRRGAGVSSSRPERPRGKLHSEAMEGSRGSR